MTRCPACSAKAPDDARFCPGCGGALGTDPDLATRTTTPDRAVRPRSRDLSSSAPSDGGRFLPGTLLAERYRIVGLVGRGGMGEVYRADDLKLGQAVALKFLPESIEKNPATRARLLGEVKIARQISHANVCRVYDIGEVDGRHFLSMEYVDGEDLASLLRRIGRLPGDKALQIARQLCAGLAAAHEQGVLHRDLKPSNVMIDGRGRARLTDFGLAAAPTEVAGAEIGSGTPAYMAPEQRAGKEVTVRSDLYALGLVLYELFTGKAAVSSPDADLVTSPSRIVPGFDPAVERAILRCLEKDPRGRPASALAVAASLPGGDPLAAALAAGETPSPEMVANAAEAGGLPPAIAVACVLGTLLAAVAGWGILSSGLRVSSVVPMPKPPAALAVEAGQLLRELGHEDAAGDEAFGFEYREDYARHVERTDRSPGRFDDLNTVRPSPIRFWYRESPRPLAPVMSGWGVDLTDPPPTVPGEASVVLDPSGRLVELLVVPPEVEVSEEDAAEPDWSTLLAKAGLDPSLLRPARPTWNPLVDCDRRTAWEGTYAGRPDTAIRVEAGAYRGAAVYFRVIPPWTTAARTAPPTRRGETLVATILLLLFAAILGVGAFLARRNVRLGRGDRRGAFRLAAFVFGANLVRSALSGHHVLAVSEVGRFFESAAWSLLVAGIFWTVYLALEPYVRRLWPEALISWTRLLQGRFRDPAIGRDILLGGVGTIPIVAAVWLSALIPGWTGTGGPTPFEADLSKLLGLRFALARVLDTMSGSLVFPIAALFLLFLLRVVLRRDWIAVTLLTLIFGVVSAAQSDTFWIDAPISAILFAIILTIVVRRGLLATISIFVFWNLIVEFPLTWDFSAWHAWRGLFGLVAILALVGFAFRASLAGRPLFRESLLPE